jgi:Ca2+-binding RTX toxin-like protein
MGMQLQGRVTAGDVLLDDDLRDLQIIRTAAGTFLYAATGQNGGLSVYQVYSDGCSVTLSDSAYYTVAGTGIGPLSVVTMQDKAQLVLEGTGAGRLVCYDLATAGQIGALDLVDLPGSSTAEYAALAGTTLSGGISAYYMVNATTGALEAYTETAPGKMQGGVARDGPLSAYTLGGQVTLDMVKVDGTGFLLAASSDRQDVTSYQINATTGGLQATDSIGAPQGLGIAMPTAMQTVTAYGATWVILGAADSHSLSVMQLHSTGRLRATDHVMDTRETRFGGVQALAVTKAEGRVFIVAGGSDDGLSLFTLLPDGRLVHLQSLAHDTGLGLDNVSAIEAVRIGNTIQIFVTSQGDGGLSQFSVSVGGLGVVRDNTGATAPTVLTGTAGDDLIIGGSKLDTFDGGAGDDILVSGHGGGVFTGGKGADLFVLSPVIGPYLGVPLRISDFEAGIDQLDLTAFTMLRSAAQLSVHSIPTGVRLGYGDHVVVITSHNGKPLTGWDLWGNGFSTPDRLLVLNPPGSGAVYGTPGNDKIIGDAGLDQLHGDSGADVLRGGAGNDQLFGNAGRDKLMGGRGNDTLRGGDGRDALFGDRGNDTLFGGKGKDTLQGGEARDVLRGGADDDTLFGNAGRDRILGERGSDTLTGGAGRDTLDGGKGRDKLLGGTGADSLKGGGAGDTLRGGKGDDRMWGHAGRDRMLGDSNDDMLNGGSGADVLLGGKGRDSLSGGKGGDILSGGSGGDRFVFAAEHGRDVITDFTIGQDQIQLAFKGASFDDLVLKSLGSDARIITGEGSVTLIGVTLADLSADDFLFS